MAERTKKGWVRVTNVYWLKVILGLFIRSIWEPGELRNDTNAAIEDLHEGWLVTVLTCWNMKWDYGQSVPVAVAERDRSLWHQQRSNEKTRMEKFLWINRNLIIFTGGRSEICLEIQNYSKSSSSWFFTNHSLRDETYAFQVAPKAQAFQRPTLLMPMVIPRSNFITVSTRPPTEENLTPSALIGHRPYHPHLTRNQHSCDLLRAKKKLQNFEISLRTPDPFLLPGISIIPCRCNSGVLEWFPLPSPPACLKGERHLRL